MDLPSVHHLSFVFLLLVGCSHMPADLQTRTQPHMGTFVSISLPSSHKKQFSPVFKIFRDLDQSLSHYLPKSEISRINRGESITASSETLDILKRSKEIHQLTDGYFDITMGTLSSKVFLKAKKEKREIKSSETKSAMKFSGFKNLSIKKGGVRAKNRMQIDLGGIGKGFAVDQVASFLKSKGLQEGQISASGDIRCLHRCTLYIQDPKNEKQKLGPIKAKVNDLSVSTSGNYRNYAKNKDSNHLFSPKTGESQRIFASVTVFTQNDNTLADALATAIATMPLNKALETLKKLKVGAFLILNNGKWIKTREADLFVDFSSH